MKVGFISLGCPKNQLDTEVMLHEVAEAGYEITPEDIDADIICMDCNFIQEGENQGRSIDILTSVLAMFQKLGMQVLIKGITNSEQLYFLKALKCNFFMGSSLSAPLSVEEFNKKY